MTTARLRSARGSLSGSCRVPGDKSISHRAALLAAIAAGDSRIRGFSTAGDCATTVAVLRRLGVAVVRRGGDLYIGGRGVERLCSPAGPLDCGRSGTTMRLLAGVLAGARFRSVLSGEDQLRRRPMGRVADPLSRMGARVTTTAAGTAPITIEGAALHGIDYVLPVASAQVKSAILLAGLQATGGTTVVEAVATRDHTERLLRAMGASPEVTCGDADGAVRTSIAAAALEPVDVEVPGDFSSAAPLIVAATLVPGSDVVVADVGLNPSRTGLLRILERMGAAVEIEPGPPNPEPRGRIRVRPAQLTATTVTAAEVPALIDELPLVGLLGACAEGRTEVHGAAELRAKESDRIAGLVSGLRALGAVAEELPDGFAVHGPVTLGGGRCDAAGDHRLAMAFAVAGLIASGPVHLEGSRWVADSFPTFFETLRRLGAAG